VDGNDVANRDVQVDLRRRQKDVLAIGGKVGINSAIRVANATQIAFQEGLVDWPVRVEKKGLDSFLPARRLRCQLPLEKGRGGRALTNNAGEFRTCVSKNPAPKTRWQKFQDGFPLISAKFFCKAICSVGAALFLHVLFFPSFFL